MLFSLAAYNNLLQLGKLTAALLLSMWIAINIANTFWRLSPNPDLRETNFSVSSRAFAPAKREVLLPVDIDVLKNIALFGSEELPVPTTDVAPIPEPIQETLEETRLSLSLVGSFPSQYPNMGYAIIASGREQKLYKVAEQVADLDEVKLLQVFTDRIVLSNRGRQEVLYMYPEGQPLTSTTEAIYSESPSTDIDESQDSNNSLASLSSEQRLQKISDAVRFSRKTKDGKMLGFRVLPGRNRSAFDRTGLKLNDVVTAIDGQTLDTFKVANDVYRQKRNATRASLTVLRDDEEIIIDVDLNTINAD